MNPENFLQGSASAKDHDMCGVPALLRHPEKLCTTQKLLLDQPQELGSRHVLTREDNGIEDKTH